MNKSTIILKHGIGSGGAGDYLRCCLSLYAFCQRERIEMYLDFSENPFFGECFEYEPIPDRIKNIINDSTNMQNGLVKILNIDRSDLFIAEYKRDEMEHHLVDILANPRVYVLNSNCVGFENREDLLESSQKFITEFIKPSKAINDEIKKIYDAYNLADNSYISIHIRCGDKNIKTTNNNRSGDNRRDLNNVNDSAYMVRHIKVFLDNIEKTNDDKNTPILIHSDSDIMKKYVSSNTKCISLNVEIQHIAENLGANNRESYISTIAEFFILMKAKTIFMCGAYTGFSHIAAVIGRKPFYVTTRTDYITKLGPVEIYNVCINPIKISSYNQNDVPSKSLKIIERHNIKKEFDILIVVGEKITLMNWGNFQIHTKELQADGSYLITA